MLSPNRSLMDMIDEAPVLSAAVIARLRGHAGFPRAMRAAAQCAVDLYRGDRLLNALMNDRARALFTHVALYLHHADNEPDGPGLSVGAMKELCVRIGLCSRGRCEAMLALMRAGGMLAAVPSRDRRRRLLVPTDRLLALHHARWGAHFAAMSAAIPRAAAYQAALDDPRFVKVFVRELGRRFIAGMRILDAAPDLEDIAERNAGMMILYSLALAGADQDAFPPVGPVPLSINALATRFSVSRKHVLTLLRDAEAQGLLKRCGAANNEIMLLPRGRDALENMLASMFLYMAECAEMALRTGRATAASSAVASPLA
jgi:hypothetical protein